MFDIAITVTMPATANKCYNNAANEPDHNCNASNERESDDVGDLSLGWQRRQLPYCHLSQVKAARQLSRGF